MMEKMYRLLQRLCPRPKYCLVNKKGYFGIYQFRHNIRGSYDRAIIIIICTIALFSYNIFLEYLDYSFRIPKTKM